MRYMSLSRAVPTGLPRAAEHRPSLHGAISENMPAPIGDATDWTSKWAGPQARAAS
jgi:hypothetical protein